MFNPKAGKLTDKFKSDWISFLMANEVGAWQEERAWHWLQLNNLTQSETGRQKMTFHQFFLG